MAATARVMAEPRADYWLLAKSFERSLLAANRSPATIRIYTASVEYLGRFLEARGMPLVLAHITREHVEEFLSDILRHSRPNTAETRYRGLRAFFNWAVENGELSASPMARLKPPAVPEEPPAMLSDADVKRLLAACDGKSFLARRDTAILRLFIDTGMRRSELAYLKLADIDLDHNVAYVMGKGRRPRACPFGRKAAQALDRYLRLRGPHPQRGSEMLWLGSQGGLTDSAVDQMLRRRAKQAGLTGVHAHLLRHGFAHAWLMLRSSTGSTIDGLSHLRRPRCRNSCTPAPRTMRRKNARSASWRPVATRRPIGASALA